MIKNTAHKVTEAWREFLRLESAGGLMLVAAAVLAMALANSPLADGYTQLLQLNFTVMVENIGVSKPLLLWVNDGLMTLFFFLVALELKRELVLGKLSNPRTAALSIAGALGGMLLPTVLYLILQWGEHGHHGWGTVMATDAAFVIGCLGRFWDRASRTVCACSCSPWLSLMTSAPLSAA